ncbi:amidohydrolase family protein [Sphingomonas elodea]|uniref:amidohydrolase family protein n=1 Tax=Sphingomonas elodea TaxID=179878 RepID=UPI000263086F|nr:amidohydrolase family protein [Sphingomonas elodea]
MRPPFVDAHLHLWDRERLRYPWLDEADKASIAATYTVAQHRAAAADWNLVGAVHVDAGAHPDDGERETDWLNSIADAEGLPSAIVARVALDAPDVEAVLARQAARARVVGIRHLINWHPDPSRQAYSRDLTMDPAWRRGFGLLAQHGLSYDFHGFPPQLAGLAEVAAAHPDVPVIVNHLGLPIPQDGLEAWRAGLTALAAMPQVAIKLSGAGFVASPFDPAAFAPIVEEVIELFGIRRVMVASNFPTDRLFAPLDTTLAAYEALLAGYSDDERRDLWGRNANRIYRLDLHL